MKKNSKLTFIQLIIILCVSEKCNKSKAPCASSWMNRPIPSWILPLWQKESTFLQIETLLLIILNNLISWIKKGHRVRLRENEYLFRCRVQLQGNLLHFVRAGAHLSALMTRKSCALRMRNAIQGNHLIMV